MFFSRSVVRGARRVSNIVYSFENVHLCSEEKIAQIKSCVTNTVVTFGNPSTLRGIDPYLIRTICTRCIKEKQSFVPELIRIIALKFQYRLQYIHKSMG